MQNPTLSKYSTIITVGSFCLGIIIESASDSKCSRSMWQATRGAAHLAAGEREDFYLIPVSIHILKHLPPTETQQKDMVIHMLFSIFTLEDR